MDQMDIIVAGATCDYRMEVIGRNAIKNEQWNVL